MGTEEGTPRDESPRTNHRPCAVLYPERPVPFLFFSFLLFFFPSLSLIFFLRLVFSSRKIHESRLVRVRERWCPDTNDETHGWLRIICSVRRLVNPVREFIVRNKIIRWRRGPSSIRVLVAEARSSGLFHQRSFQLFLLSRGVFASRTCSTMFKMEEKWFFNFVVTELMRFIALSTSVY